MKRIKTIVVTTTGKMFSFCGENGNTTLLSTIRAKLNENGFTNNNIELIHSFEMPDDENFNFYFLFGLDAVKAFENGGLKELEKQIDNGEAELCLYHATPDTSPADLMYSYDEYYNYSFLDIEEYNHLKQL